MSTWFSAFAAAILLIVLNCAPALARPEAVETYPDDVFSTPARFKLGKSGSDATEEHTDDSAPRLAQQSVRENKTDKDKDGNQERGEEPSLLDFPELTGHVIDEANLLSENEGQDLAKSLVGFEDKTTHRVVIVTLASLHGRRIEDYSHQLEDYWGFNSEKNDNYILLVVAPTERKVRLEAGRGVSKTLTERRSRQIIQNRILPRFREGSYAAGIKEGLDAIFSALAGDDTEYGTSPTDLDALEDLPTLEKLE